MLVDEFCGVRIVLGFEMSAERKAGMARDLAEEAKKRIVFLVICVIGLSYLMSCKYWYFVLMDLFKNCQFYWFLLLVLNPSLDC